MTLLRPVIVFIGLIVLWQAIVWATGAPVFILPPPLLVFATIIEQRAITIPKDYKLPVRDQFYG